GAAFLTILPESLRFLDVPIALTGHVQQALIGIAILAVMRLRPTGIVGRYEL
ncbi:branched-chain amino acid ABC transporter permease, partial [Candidatus Uhrbacteria bacterium]|nr:branched-chain amino acid ABC transporter permease [Candidatus Uhrbacteria bacterium]